MKAKNLLAAALAGSIILTTLVPVWASTNYLGIGDTSRGNHKLSSYYGSEIIVPRPSKSIYQGGYNNGATNVSKIVSFNDISDHWAEKKIKDFASKGYINGYNDGSFKPNDTITYSEMFTILSNLNTRPVRFLGAFGGTIQDDNTKYYFKDGYKIKGQWYHQAILKASETGYLGSEIFYDGTAGEIFRKNNIEDKATRGNVALYLSNMLEYKENDIASNLDFIDSQQIYKDIPLVNNPSTVLSSDYTLNAIKRLYSNKIITGYSDGSFKPQNTITRAEFVVIVQNILDLYNNDMEIIGDNLYGNFNLVYWEQEKILFDEVNKARAENNLSPLIFDKNLTAIAYLRSLDYTINGYAWDGSHYAQTLKKTADTNIFNIPLSKFGENLNGSHNIGGIKLHLSWMSSDAHKKNVLFEHYTHIGVCNNIYYTSELFAY